MIEMSPLESEPLPATPKGLYCPELLRQIARFGIVGVIGFVVNAGVVAALALSLGPLWAQCLAFPLAASATWWLNRVYTFGASRHAWKTEWLRYLTANTLGFSVNNGVYFTLVLLNPMAYSHPAFAVALGSLAGMVFNFSFSKWAVYS